MPPAIALNIILALNGLVFPVVDLPSVTGNPAYAPLDQQVAENLLSGQDAVADGERESFNYATAPSPDLVSKFTNASQKYQVPVDTLMAMAQKDSGFNPFIKSAGPGPKTRGIINMSEAEVSTLSGNPYNADTSIDHAARKLRGFLDSGMSLDDAVKALYAGPNRAKWGPDADRYLADVTARTGPLADRFFPAPKPTVVAAVPSTPPANALPKREPEPTPPEFNEAQEVFMNLTEDQRIRAQIMLLASGGTNFPGRSVFDKYIFQATVAFQKAAGAQATGALDAKTMTQLERRSPPFFKIAGFQRIPTPPQGGVNFGCRLRWDLKRHNSKTDTASKTKSIHFGLHLCIIKM